MAAKPGEGALNLYRCDFQGAVFNVQVTIIGPNYYDSKFYPSFTGSNDCHRTCYSIYKLPSGTYKVFVNYNSTSSTPSPTYNSPGGTNYELDNNCFKIWI